jgi:dihydrofolate synthase/folylpolyglutamate synthase
VAAVTTIGYDHMYILGDTLDAIAREKAHIAKPCTPLVVASNQSPKARQAIEQVAAATLAEVAPTPQVRRQAPTVKGKVGPDGTWTPPRDRLHVQTGPLTGEYDTALVGEHQAVNAAVAIGILEQLLATGYTIEPMHVAEGLGKVRWPGRLDVRACRPWLVFDCAHNGQSAGALARAIPEYLDYDRPTIVVGMSGDKDIAAFAAALAPLGARVILTRAAIDRALPVEEVASSAGGLWDGAEQIADVGQACQRALESAGEEGAVCITGSFYVVGEAMQGLGIEP